MVAQSPWYILVYTPLLAQHSPLIETINILLKVCPAVMTKGYKLVNYSPAALGSVL